MKSTDDNLLLFLSLLFVFVFGIMWWKSHEKQNFDIPPSVRNRWNNLKMPSERYNPRDRVVNNYNPWSTGDTPLQCQRKYASCIMGCRTNPYIGCPGQCQEEQEYCQEFEM